MEQLESDLSEYFGYLPELIGLFLKMFSPSEALEFLDASDKPRPLVIRTNTLKARRKVRDEEESALKMFAILKWFSNTTFVRGRRIWRKL